MLSKSQFLDSIELEFNLCKHIHSKLDDAHIEFRPNGDMRSTLELMQYLCRCGYLPAHAIVNNAWNEVGAGLEAAKSISAADFPSRLDTELEEIKGLLANLSDEELASRKVQLPPPWGVEIPLGRALVETSLKFLTAYRMQLCLYAKQAGLRSLNTTNFWVGTDGPWPPGS